MTIPGKDLETAVRAHEGILANRNLGIYHIPLTHVILNELNERQTLSSEGVESLANSIALTGGNITACISEYLKGGKGVDITRDQFASIIADLDDDDLFKMLGGNRRTIASRFAGLPDIKTRVLVNLTPVERYEIQFIENATKTKIPPHQVANSIWEMFLVRASLAMGNKTVRQIERLGVTDYWNMPAKIKQRLDDAGFNASIYAKAIGKSRSSVLAAFRYQRVSHRIKNDVEAGRIPYAIAEQFGRIPNQDMQELKYKHYGDAVDESPNVKFNSSHAAKFVSAYLRELQDGLEGRFAGADWMEGETGKIDPFRDMNKRMARFDRELRKIDIILTDDSKYLENGGKYYNQYSLESMIGDIKSRIDSLHDAYQDNPNYIRAIEAEDKEKPKPIPLLQQIKNGNIEYDINKDRLIGLDLSKTKCDVVMSLDDIFPCSTQVRKDFEEQKIVEMAKTIKKYGILQNITVRPKGGKFEIVVGETRYRAAKLAGISHIYVDVCPMDDMTAQIVRIEEDIFEEVNIIERAEKLFAMYKIIKRDKEIETRKEISELEVRLTEAKADDRETIKDSLTGLRMALEEDTYYTFTDFKVEHYPKNSILREALKYASIEEGIKDTIGQFTGYSTIAALADITNPNPVTQEGLRKRYGYSSMLLDLPVTELKRRIRHSKDCEIERQADKQISMFNIPDPVDCHDIELKDMMGMFVDKLYSMKNVLQYRSVVGRTGDFDSRLVNLTEHITEVKNFRFLYRLKKTVDKVHAKISGTEEINADQVKYVT